MEPGGPPPPRPRPITEATLVVPVEPSPPEAEEERLPAPPKLPGDPPRNPTLKEIYDLVDKRLAPEIIERISSAPPAAVEARPSKAVQAVQATGRYGKAFMAITGGVMLLLQGFAWYDEYRGPISQGVLIAGKLLDLWEARQLKDVPPEPLSPPPAPEAE